MSIEQALLEKLRALPLEKQQEVLDFAEFLYQRNAVKRTQRSIKGLWANFNIDITEKDIADARQEMWSNFPREIE